MAAARGLTTTVAAFLLGLAPHAGGAAELPAGTELQVRLTTPIPRRPPAGLAVSAVLVAPVVQDGRVLLAAGTAVNGTVVESGHLPQDRHRAYLRVAFDQIVPQGGAARPLRMRVTEVDDAREKVDAEGRIVGLASLRARPTSVEAVLLLAGYAHPVILAAAEAAKLAVRRADRAPIEYAAGVEMTLALVQPLSVDAVACARPRDLSADPDLAELASTLPTRTRAARFNRPADVTNVLFVGSRDEVKQSFLAAGWTETKPMGLRTAAHAFLALAGRHGYKPAPVSRQELGGSAPALVFEKQNNTLAKRHHIRIWARAESFEGEAVWLAAASHDVAIVFDRGDRTFTHRIDGRIDLEREKVAADLEYTARVRATGLLARPELSQPAQTATGGPLVTDGGLRVIVLGEAPSLPSAVAASRW